MNCKVQKYRVLVMGLLILSLMGLSGCGRQESTANVPKLKDPVGVDVDTAKVKKMNLSSVNSYSGEVVPDMVGVYFASRNWRQGKEGSAFGYTYRFGVDGERLAEGVKISDCRKCGDKYLFSE
mgnify:CR=1 FL=1